MTLSTHSRSLGIWLVALLLLPALGRTQGPPNQNAMQMFEATGHFPTSALPPIPPGYFLCNNTTALASPIGCVSLPVGSISGLAAVATTGSASDLNGGTLSTARLPILNGGDCTTPGGSGVLTCTKTNGVSFAPIATSGSASDLSAGTILAARLSGSTVQAVAVSPYVVDATNSTYGADKTGVADSTTAIQSALNTGNDTFLPCGTYKTSSGLTSTGKQRLFGQGKGCVSIKPTGNFDAFTCNGGNGCGVTDITVNGVNQTGGNAIVLENAGRDYIHNVVIVNAQNGIFIETCNVCEIHDVWVNGVAGTYAVQWYGDNTHRSDVLDIDNLIVGGSGSPTSSSAECILMDGNVNTMDLRHAGCTNMLRGLHIQNSSGGSAPAFVTTDDFQVDFPYAEGIRVEGGARSIFLKDSYAQASSTADGIYFDSTVQNAEVLGGQISSNFQRGIAALGRYIKVVSAQVTTNSQAGSALWPEIEIGGSSFGNTVTSSLVGQWIGYASELASYGVKTDTGAVDYSIVGNVLCANVTGAYLDSAADTNSIIFGNSCATSTLSNLAAPGSGNLFVGNANGHIAEYSASNANTVNYVHYFGSITGVSPIVQCDGTDTNVNCVYAARGTGNWFWKYNGGATIGLAMSGTDGGMQVYNAGTAPSGGDKGAGSIDAATTITAQTGFVIPITTVASLPTCNTAEKGILYAVSDATTPTFDGTLTGGSSTYALAFCNGTAWSAH